METYEKKELKKRSTDLSGWYTDVVLKAELADYAPVKGTMVIRPYGYAIWERVQEVLNRMMSRKGVQNAYFPLFIPHSLLEKEKEHVEGFSPELALVTVGGGEKLADPLVVRPTSETIMYSMYAKWIKSWRDLPVLINQWNNVVRWEKRTYLFLRTMEFLWQEGHTVHETETEAMEMVMTALGWYANVYEEYFAVPVLRGRKSESEKFAGAKETYCVEALMPDGKALQAGTSHNLGQNFARVFEIRFQSRDKTLEYAWQTSWGLSTRSLGGLFLTHGDDDGLIMPPKIAPYQAVVIPIYKKGTDENTLREYAGQIAATLKEDGREDAVRVYVDDSTNRSPGRKFNTWEVRGVPIRIEVGSEELAQATVTIVRRDSREKSICPAGEVKQTVMTILDAIQSGLFARAKKFLEDNTHTVATYEEFREIMSKSRGFIHAYWCEDPSCEKAIKDETKATSRCLTLDEAGGDGICIKCGKPARHRWVFAQAY